MARTADHLRSALGQAIVATPPAPASSDGGVPGAGVAALEQIELQLAALAHDVNALKREVAQFTALRNNLITRLDDAWHTPRTRWLEEDRAAWTRWSRLAATGTWAS